MDHTLMPIYHRLAIAFDYGKGVWLWDTHGKKYLDALSGIAVTALGHSHPAVTATIHDQAAKLLHVSNGYQIPQQYELARKLIQLSGMEQAFFCNSGAEANETAIKIARMYGHSQGIDNPMIVVMDRGFHGRTLATLSASGNRKMQEGFEPLVQGFVRVPYNDFTALKTIVQTRKDIIAVFLEPVLGNGGIIIPSENYLAEIRELCNQKGLLMIIDEVQTGIGHTGRMFAYQHQNIIPDILTLAKALGNGIPIGACLTHGSAVDILQLETHGTTVGGNPFACRVATTVLDVIEQEELLNNASQVGDYLKKQLTETLVSKKQVKEVRGLGLMIGIELTRPCAEIRQLAADRGLLCNVTAERVIRLLPPLILKNEEADLIAQILDECI